MVRHINICAIYIKGVVQKIMKFIRFSLWTNPKVHRGAMSFVNNVIFKVGGSLFFICNH